MSQPLSSSRPSPAPARTLLSVSHRLGRAALRSQDDGVRQRTQRAISRAAGRVGHWVDRRNPDGLTGSSRSARQARHVFVAGLVVGAVAAEATRRRVGR